MTALRVEDWAARFEAARKARAEELGMSLEQLDAHEREENRKRERQEQRERAEAAERSDWRCASKKGIPLRALKASMAPEASDALSRIWDVGDLVVLSGTPGVGKSVAACVWCLANGGSDCLNRESVRIWVQAGELARGFAYEQEAFDSVAKSPVLVIDDLGTEFLDQKDRYLCTLEEILTTRFANERPTMITTNLQPEAFKARYGERLASRINEDGAFIVCGGADMRRARKE